MNYDEPIKNIKVYNNAVPKHLINGLLTMAKETTEDDWEEYHHPKEHLLTESHPMYQKYIEHKKDWDKTTFTPKDRFMFEEIKKICESILDNKYTITNEIYRIKRYESGRSISVHHDDAQDFSLKFGIVVYLNDDFDGGEIYYPNFNFSYKPVTGSIIVHPATKEYEHGIRPVLNGTRYAMSCFASVLTDEQRLKFANL